MDEAGPLIEITSHKDGQTAGTPTIRLSGAVTDATRGDNGVLEVKVNNQPARDGITAGAGKALWSSVIALNLGQNVISITARDNSPAKNISARTIILIYELQSSIELINWSPVQTFDYPTAASVHVDT